MRELGEGFRRIYELMETHELKHPDLFSENKAFTISFNQKLIYTDEEKVWLENFQSIELSREERAIIRLGAKGNLLSPMQIWDTVGIVDTDVYRSYVESLRDKGILVSEVSKNQAMTIAKKQHKDKKSIPRFRIVLPQDRQDVTSDSIEVLDDSEYCKLYLENVHFDCTEKEIKTEFSKFGEVESVTIPKSSYSKKGRGFAFIEFSAKSSVDLALEYKEKIIIRERAVKIRKYHSKV